MRLFGWRIIGNEEYHKLLVEVRLLRQKVWDLEDDLEVCVQAKNGYKAMSPARDPLTGRFKKRGA